MSSEVVALQQALTKKSCVNTGLPAGSQNRVERIDHGLKHPGRSRLAGARLERDIALTGCPTFYAGQESTPAPELAMLRTLADAGVRISLNTDDPAQFGSGWLTNTLLLAMQAAPLTRAEIVRFMQNAINSAWIDDQYRQSLSTELASFVDR